ncbi:hypothetical protein OIDMADRAFT_110969 [Oidiodendron maius Zn]|uniref:Potassium channel domain-containing protein n=1 Tax=Oidiodendron maius (strain Zn) TaxID=913774 RepID=A0A0C3I039_OIDMZ|nr:hypothetical protein OIDMADRAFT_110969 [Oidiodendron maius Zn]
MAWPSPSTNSLKKTDTIRTLGRFKMRGVADDLPHKWWFASIAIPLLAATIGPLANVLSIAALASKWRVNLPNNGQLPEGTDDAGVDIADPKWETILNAISLAVGVLGNLALMFNFTKRIRYIIALPLTIIAWYIATGILIALVAAMNVYTPPIRPGQTYSQGFWYAVIAACLYMIGSMMLMINMFGYFLGHYPQHFELDDDQRTLILQTMMFFCWLAGGAAVFAKVCDWSYADALYFCDVTILTVGFGDFVAPNSIGRGLIFPYSVFGIIFLGLMIKSIRQFAIARLLLLKEEKDRFDAMRDIQASTHKFKRYYALAMSILAFGILWCVGALVFMYAEHRLQNLTYFDSLYFCYVSLLTIGYGDFSPRSNAGKPFFVVWSLIAVPTMTLLVSDMGQTVVMAINHGTYTLADWTVLPKKGVVHDFFEMHPRLKSWLERRNEKLEAKRRLQRGFSIQNPDELISPNGAFSDDLNHSNSHTDRMEQLAEEPLTEHDLARKLAIAIKATANDLQLPHRKKYSYEEWVEFTRLIRFSRERPEQVEEEEEEEGLVEWDWIGENSPMLAHVSESQWILDRLCESLNRYTKRQSRNVRVHSCFLFLPFIV